MVCQERSEMSTELSNSNINWIDTIRAIRPHRLRGQRAPYKTLLLLWMIARTAAGKSERVSFSDAEDRLKRLMWGYRMSQTLAVKYPFVYLAEATHLWRVEDTNGNNIYDMTEPIYPNKRQPGRESIRFLREEATGYLAPAFVEAIRDEEVRSQVVNELLRLQFPESLHYVMLRDLQLAHSVSYKARRRDPKFREDILEAYGERCAFCGFDSRLKDSSVGIDAAHVKMHARGGADAVDNGLALCVLHHRLFDRGAMSISDHMLMIISPLLTGVSPSTRQQVRSLESREVVSPISDYDCPDIENIRWHRDEIFVKGALRG